MYKYDFSWPGPCLPLAPHRPPRRNKREPRGVAARAASPVPPGASRLSRSRGLSTTTLPAGLKMMVPLNNWSSSRQARTLSDSSVHLARVPLVYRSPGQRISLDTLRSIGAEPASPSVRKSRRGPGSQAAAVPRLASLPRVHRRARKRNRDSAVLMVQPCARTTTSLGTRDPGLAGSAAHAAVAGLSAA